MRNSTKNKRRRSKRKIEEEEEEEEEEHVSNTSHPRDQTLINPSIFATLLKSVAFQSQPETRSIDRKDRPHSR